MPARKAFADVRSRDIVLYEAAKALADLVERSLDAGPITKNPSREVRAWRALAITTRYIGPSNVRGSRVKATAAAGSVTLHWNGALNSDANHQAAAVALAAKYGWGGKWFGGRTANGCVFVCTGDGLPHFTTAQGE